MKQVRRVIALALLLAALVVHAAAAPFDFRGKVIGIADGDTLRVLAADKRPRIIRLNGIDAPESGQDFGQVSKRHLSDLVFGKEVTVFGTKLDRYGRYVGTVVVDGTDANLEQLRAGMAWFYSEYAGDVPVDRRPAYQQAETEARTAKRGLWNIAGAIPPWDFRHPRSAAVSAAVLSNSRIIGNRNSKIYHLPNCPDYSRVAERNRIYFDTPQDAERAGFRQARNCP